VLCLCCANILSLSRACVCARVCRGVETDRRVERTIERGGCLSTGERGRGVRGRVRTIEGEARARDLNRDARRGL
jgi:hypothetical protein